MGLAEAVPAAAREPAAEARAVVLEPPGLAEAVAVAVPVPAEARELPVPAVAVPAEARELRALAEPVAEARAELPEAAVSQERPEAVELVERLL